VSDKQCAECSYYRGDHAYYCSRVTIEELRKRVMWSLELERRETNCNYC